ncbi:hypothetical protein OESDEN_06469 [Oesophagostomum dentatum]|uniref:Uncharacterized protein n=1 Tax=Oesophagostomum dentatum TaxID=61180 RepID=A0A0B1TE32_OESDE|nr:hypothetical protein OESDEN_06469 [Oesophagostomum dentatum]
MDTLALLYAQNTPPMAKELESLATQLMNSNENTVEACIAFGHCARVQGKLKTALYFAHKACNQTIFGDKPKSEAMLLKALVLLDLEKFDEAMRHLSAAIKRDVKNIDLYELQIVTYLQRAKIREARAAVSICMQNLPNSPRARVLKAQVLLASASGKEMTHLEPALSFTTPPIPSTPTGPPGNCPGAPRLRGRQRHATPSSEGTDTRGVRLFSFDSSMDDATADAMDVHSES